MTGQKRVLIIDDEPDILVIMAFRLKKAGYDVVSARSARDGLRLLGQLGPDLILTDMNLPDMSVEGLCSAVRTDDRFRNLPIIVLSAGSEEFKKRVLAAGAQEFLTKPCEQEHLVAVLDALLGER
ncbi:MAG: response regulator [Elusimicrobiaceae bacterium]|nr:response regulator [Elusimicrobiaceae bacterium]